MKMYVCIYVRMHACLNRKQKENYNTTTASSCPKIMDRQQQSVTLLLLFFLFSRRLCIVVVVVAVRRRTGVDAMESRLDVDVDTLVLTDLRHRYSKII